MEGENFGKLKEEKGMAVWKYRGSLGLERRDLVRFCVRIQFFLKSLLSKLQSLASTLRKLVIVR